MVTFKNIKSENIKDALEVCTMYLNIDATVEETPQGEFFIKYSDKDVVVKDAEAVVGELFTAAGHP